MARAVRRFRDFLEVPMWRLGVGFDISKGGNPLSRLANIAQAASARPVCQSSEAVLQSSNRLSSGWSNVEVRMKFKSMEAPVIPAMELAAPSSAS